MAKYDQYNDLVFMNALNTQTIATDTTTNGVIIDTKGYESLTFVIKTGTLTDGDYTPLIRHGDASNLSDVADVADADLIGTEAGAAFTDDTDDNTVTKIGYRGGRRYVRLSIVSTGTTSGASITGIAVLGKPTMASVEGLS